MMLQKYSMMPGLLSPKFSEEEEILVLQLFDRLSWNFEFKTVEDIILPKNIEEILLAVDYDYFQKTASPNSKIITIVPIIKAYMLKILKFKIDLKIEKQLILKNQKTWIALLLYLFGNCEQKMIFVQEMMQCSSEAQEYFMFLMGQIIEKIEEKEPSDKHLSGIEEIENQLNQKIRQLSDTKRDLEILKLQNISLREENEKLGQALSDHMTEKAEQLELVNVSTMEELIELYKEALEVNQSLNNRIQKFEDQNSQLQQLYSGMSHDLIIAKQQNQEKDTALRRRGSCVSRTTNNKTLRFETHSDSDEQITYRDSIEMHTKPLKEQIGHLGRYSNNLKLQMRMLYRQFQTFTRQLKPLKDQGMFQDVPRSVF